MLLHKTIVHGDTYNQSNSYEIEISCATVGRKILTPSGFFPVSDFLILKRKRWAYEITFENDEKIICSGRQRFLNEREEYVNANRIYVGLRLKCQNMNIQVSSIHRIMIDDFFVSIKISGYYRMYYILKNKLITRD